MTRADRDAALDELRAELAGQLRNSWRFRCRGSHRECFECGQLRERIARLRALDLIRAEAHDRAHMAALWMYLACGLSQADAAAKARADVATPAPGGEP